MTELVCIACPRGCRLKVDEDNAVTGNACPRGEEYGRNEVCNPMRIITSTVKIKNAAYPRLPVRLDTPIPKRLIFDAMRILDGVTLTAPVKRGQVVVSDICGTGANFVSERDMRKQLTIDN